MLRVRSFFPGLRPALTAAAAFALLLAGCTSAEVKPAGLTTATLDAEARRAEVTTPLGSELKIALPAPSQPGHVWQIMFNDMRFLQPLNEISPPAADGGRSTVSFHAIRQGRSALKFLAVPADNPPEAVPVDFYDVVVTIE